MLDEKMKINTKLAIEEMFSNKNEQPQKKEKEISEENLNDESELYPKKITSLVTRKNFKDYNAIFFKRKMSGEPIKKLEFFNEVLEFYIKHHKPHTKKENV